MQNHEQAPDVHANAVSPVQADTLDFSYLFKHFRGKEILKQLSSDWILDFHALISEPHKGHIWKQKRICEAEARISWSVPVFSSVKKRNLDCQ